MTHPRCLNCHTVTAFPRQGDDRHAHQFRVVRGTDDKGVAGMRCVTCHQSENQSSSGVPGGAGWYLAPLSMAWEARPGVAMKGPQLCRSLLDRAKNGGMTLAELRAHLAEEPLVRWAWSPGVDAAGRPRNPPPLSHAEFLRAADAWIAAGAPCPK